MKKIMIVFIAFLWCTSKSYCQETPPSNTLTEQKQLELTSAPISSIGQSKLFHHVAVAFSAGQNFSIKRGKFASDFLIEIPIYKFDGWVVTSQLSLASLNLERQSLYGDDYGGKPNYPKNGYRNSFFDFNAFMLNTGIHKLLSHSMSLGGHLGVGLNQALEQQRIVLYYFSGNGTITPIAFVTERQHNFLAFSMATEFRYALTRRTSFQLIAKAFQPSLDMKTQIAIQAGFVRQLKR